MQAIKNTKFFFLTCASALICIFALFIVLIVSSFYKQYTEDTRSLEAFISERFTHQLSRLAKFGRPPDRISNLPELIANFQKDAQSYHLVILDSDLEIIAKNNYEPTSFLFPQNLDKIEQVHQGTHQDTLQKNENHSLYFDIDDITWILQPIIGQKTFLTQGTTQSNINSLLQDKLRFPLEQNQAIMGYVAHAFEKSSLFDSFKDILIENFYYLLASILLALILLYILLRTIVLSKTTQENPYKKMYLYIALFVPLLVSQGIFILIFFSSIQSIQEKNMFKMGTQFSSQIAQGVEHINRLNIKLADIPDAIPYFMRMQENFPWVTNIEIIEQEATYTISNPLYSQEIHAKQTNTQKAKPSEVERLYASSKIESPKNELKDTAQHYPLKKDKIVKREGQVNVFISQDFIRDILFKILLDIFTTTVVVIVFLVEFINMFFIYDAFALRKNIALEKSSQNKLDTPIPSIFDAAEIMRPIIFTCLFCVFLSISFIPLRMATISPDFLGLSRDISMSIPVSVEMLCVGFAVMIGGLFSEKIGWRRLLLCGSLFVALGNFMSAFFDMPILFILSRAIAGIGYGSINIAPQLFIFEKSPPEKRTQNLALMSAGLCAGLLCGSAFGGIIADRLGFSIAFYTASSIMFCIFMILVKFLPKQAVKLTTTQTVKRMENEAQAHTENIDTPKEKHKKLLQNPLKTQVKAQEKTLDALHISGIQQVKAFFQEMKGFCTNIPVLTLLLMNIMPCAFVTVCINNYYLPVSLNSIGASTADIGRVSMFFSLMVVYVGPTLGRLIDKHHAHQNPNSSLKSIVIWLFSASILCVFSLYCFSISNSIIMATCAVTLLGIANAILYSAQGPYALDLPASKAIDRGKVVAVYNLSERFGQFLGPVCLAILISFSGVNNALVIISGILLCCSFLFLLSSKSNRKVKNHSNNTENL